MKAESARNGVPLVPLARRLAECASGHPHAVISIVLLLCLGPFLDKAVHIDDTLFVWTAERLPQHPGDFYGFDVNWTSRTLPMSVENCNPPAASYFLAAVGVLSGWRLVFLHGAMMLVAFAAAAGTYQLAKMWCGRPLLAVLIAMVTPVFLVSATTLMCDVPMFAVWIWAMVFWERALAGGKTHYLLLASVLAGLAVLTKYSALALLPLLPIAGLLRKRKAGWWLLWLVIPVAVIELYEMGTARLYGQGLISAAAKYAAGTRFSATGGWVNKAFIGLAYAGGCLLPVLFFAPRLWTKRELLVGGLRTAAIAGAVLWVTGIGAEFGWGFRLQMGLFLAAGIHVLVLGAFDLWRQRDATSLLLALWLGSGLYFAAVMNWTVSARSFLPLLPPAAILVVRGLGRRNPGGESIGTVVWPLGLSLLMGLAVSGVDIQLANSGRDAARSLAAEYGSSGRLWFEGHRGFQYYVQKTGARPVDYNSSILQRGDLLVLPANGNTLVSPSSEDVETVATHQFSTCGWLSTVNAGTGAGFYGGGGLLPFVFGPVPVEQYLVYRVTRTLCFAPPEILNNLAWRLATSPDPQNRNGSQAVALAERACELTQYSTTIFLGTLGAAYAEAGRFDDAIASAEKACASARAQGDADLLRANERLLVLYEAHRPYHEVAEKLVPGTR